MGAGASLSVDPNTIRYKNKARSASCHSGSQSRKSGSSGGRQVFILPFLRIRQNVNIERNAREFSRYWGQGLGGGSSSPQQSAQSDPRMKYYRPRQSRYRSTMSLGNSWSFFPTDGSSNGGKRRTF